MEEEKLSPRRDRWFTGTKNLLGSIDLKFFQRYSISIVPEQLRRGNENAYMPKVVSMGPQNKGRRELLPMEEIKLRCMLSLLHRTEAPVRSLRRCMTALLKEDALVRASYVEEIREDRYELATIMLHDGCFLLELFISSYRDLRQELPTSSSDDRIGAQVGKMPAVLTDLTLLENQIPLFIPHILFESLFSEYCYQHGDNNKEANCKLIVNMAQSLFGYSSSLDLSSSGHFLELFHLSFMEQNRKLEESDHKENQHSLIAIGSEYYDGSNRGMEVEGQHVKLKRCVTRLIAARVTIKRLGAMMSNNNNNNKRVSIFPFGSSILPSFSKGVLEIPQLHVTQRTETEWRNFIALEHHMKKRNVSSVPAFTLLAILFSDLICCSRDVRVLRDLEIIVVDDSLKKMRNRDLEALFHSMTIGVDRGIVDSRHAKMFHDLNKCNAANSTTRFTILLCHSIRAMAESIYSEAKTFLWRGYNFAAAIITLLTVIQTIYTVISYHFPKK